MLWWSSMVCFVFESSNWAICIASSRTGCWPRLFSSIFPIPKFGDSSRSVAMDYRWTIYAELSSHIHVISLANSQMCHRDILWWSLKTGGASCHHDVSMYFSPLDSNQLQKFSGFADKDPARTSAGRLSRCLSPPAFNETATPFKGATLLLPRCSAQNGGPQLPSWTMDAYNAYTHLLYLWTITTFDVWYFFCQGLDILICSFFVLFFHFNFRFGVRIFFCLAFSSCFCFFGVWSSIRFSFFSVCFPISFFLQFHLITIINAKKGKAKLKAKKKL